eukprot:UN03319
MLHLLCIIMVTMPFMMIPSFGTNFRLTPLEGSEQLTKKRKIKSFEDLKKLYLPKKATKPFKYPTFKELNDVYQAQNVMTAVMRYSGEKEGRPYGMFLDPQGEGLEAFRKKIDTKTDKKRNPGRVAKGFTYEAGKVALFMNIPQVIASKSQFNVEPGWIWMWVSANDKINKLLGARAMYKKGPWIFLFRYTEFKPPAEPVHRAKLADDNIQLIEDELYYYEQELNKEVMDEVHLLRKKVKKQNALIKQPQDQYY